MDDYTGASIMLSPSTRVDCCDEAVRIGEANQQSHALFPACVEYLRNDPVWDGTTCNQAVHYYKSGSSGDTASVDSAVDQQICCTHGIA